MSPGRSKPGPSRRDHVLDVALQVFGRHGFRKTSMEDVARAADISRQGLYLHFSSKEELFRAAASKELETALEEASRCLNQEDVDLEHRVVGALDAWLGRYVGSMLASDIRNLMENPAVHLGDVVDTAVAALDARLAAAIAGEMTPSARRRLGVTPDEVTAVLHTVGQGARHLARTRAEFLARVSTATHLVLAAIHHE